jgi:hypothetical protein
MRNIPLESSQEIQADVSCGNEHRKNQETPIHGFRLSILGCRFFDPNFQLDRFAATD